jgi:hypothetical protein
MTIMTIKDFIDKLHPDDLLQDVRIRTNEGDFYVKFIDFERDSHEKYLVLGTRDKKSF